MKIRDIFRLLEGNLTGKRVRNEKLMRSENAVAVISSPNFVDPYDKIHKEDGEPWQNHSQT